MGLFHYLLIIDSKNTFDKEQLEEFFKLNNFDITEKTSEFISFICKEKFGEIEVLVDNNELSIRTNINNDSKIINSIVRLIKLLVKNMQIEFTIFDVQSKKFFDFSNLNNLEVYYLKRQNELKKYF